MKKLIILSIFICCNLIAKSQSPTWSLDLEPSDYEYKMVVMVRLEDACKDEGDLLAIFDSTGELRGVSDDTGSDDTYLITAHSNTDSETLSFKFYDSESQEVFDKSEVTIQFVQGSVVKDIVVQGEESVPPVVHCLSKTLYLDDMGEAVLEVSDIDNGSTDNCGPISLSLSSTYFDCSHIGTQTVVLTVTDYFGNTSECTTEVMVIDSIPGEITCPSDVTQFVSSVDLSISTTGIAEYTDNCDLGEVQYTDVTVPLLGDGYMIKRMWYYSDDTDVSCNQEIKVLDDSLRDPNTTFIVGAEEVCQASIQEYIISAIPNAVSYEWSYSGAGTLVSGDSANSVLVDFLGDNSGGQLTLVVSSGHDEITLVMDINNTNDVEVCRDIFCDRVTLTLTEDLFENNNLPRLLHANKAINATGRIANGKEFTFFAGEEIILHPGFEVELGGELEAIIRSCIEGGIPD